MVQVIRSACFKPALSFNKADKRVADRACCEQRLWVALCTLWGCLMESGRFLGSSPFPSQSDSEDIAQTAVDSMARSLTLLGVSVVLPAWNEEEIIAETVASVLVAMPAITPNFEVIVVDDGSVDRTGAIADELAQTHSQVKVIHNRPNRGYGGALAAGFQQASKELVFFMDSDGQFDIHDLARLIVPFEQGEAKVSLGYRANRQDPPLRLLNAWAWKQLVSFLFQFRVRDIDCAFKLMPTELVQTVNVQSRGAMINTELLAKFARMDVKIAQVPVGHYPRQKGKATGANLKVITRAFRELFTLYGHVRNWTPDGETPSTAMPTERSFVANDDVIREYLAQWLDDYQAEIQER